LPEHNMTCVDVRKQSCKIDEQTGLEPNSCVECEAGYYCPKGEKPALPCLLSRFCPAGVAEPQLCGEGEVTLVARAQDVSECTKCPAGKKGDITHESGCRNCSYGKFTNAKSKISCLQCAAGKYASIEGATTCTQCKSNRTTQFRGSSEETDCVCREGWIEDDSGTCRVCQEGLDCPIGSKLKNLERDKCEGLQAETCPRIMPGFFSTGKLPLEIYFCSSDRACPGGAPGTCEGRSDRSVFSDGIACGACSKSAYKKQDKCTPCTDVETSRLLFPTLPVLICPLVFAVLHADKKDEQDWGKPKEGVKGTLTLLLKYIYKL